MSKFYAVAQGRIPGIYYNWSSCQAQTNGVPSKFKKCGSLEDAANYLLSAEVHLDEHYDSKLKDYLIDLTRKSTLESTLNTRNQEATEKITILPGLVQLPSTQTCNQSNASKAASIIQTMKTGMIKKSRQSTLPTKYVPQKYNTDIELPSLPPGYDAKKSREFLNLDRAHLEPIGNRIVIYIDGSKRPVDGKTHLGSGVYCRYANRDYAMSRPLNKLRVANRYCMTDSECNKLSSPSMEFMALAEVLWHFISIKLPTDDNGRVFNIQPIVLHFVCDYNGVKFWPEGSWKARETHIIKIKTVVNTIIAWLYERNIHVYVQHVDGHCNIHGNEISDVYAKSTEHHDDIDELVIKTSSNLTRQ